MEMNNWQEKAIEAYKRGCGWRVKETEYQGWWRWTPAGCELPIIEFVVAKGHEDELEEYIQLGTIHRVTGEELAMDELNYILCDSTTGSST